MASRMSDKQREERRAAALRENLKRRKAQARSLEQGDHTESRDGEAQLGRGMELLVKARTALDLQRAVEQIEAASAAGDARASEQCALLECAGAGRPVNWTKALDRLRQAAEQGSTSAGRQLMVLAQPNGEALPPELPAPNFWANVRRNTDERALVAAREGLTATERPYIGVFPKFATPAECRWLIETARKRLGPATVYDHSTGALRPDWRRTSRAAMFPFDQVDLVIEMIRARIASTLGVPLPHFEVSQVLHYAPGQEFKPHHDYFDPSSVGFQEEIAMRGQRIATFIIYLNDEFTGGETRFPSLGFNYRGSAGDAITFLSVEPDGEVNPLTLHAGLPPASGEKWIFSQWVRERSVAGQAT